MPGVWFPLIIVPAHCHLAVQIGVKLRGTQLTVVHVLPGISALSLVATGVSTGPLSRETVVIAVIFLLLAILAMASRGAPGENRTGFAVAEGRITR